MPEHLLISPDEQLLREYQEKAKGNIRYITVSPEVLGVPEMIPVMKELGMTVAIGHSGADYDTAWKCIHNGAEDGDAKLKYGGSRAGSTLTTGKALKNLIAFTGRPLEEVVPMLTRNPAKLLNVYDRIGSIATGKDADIVILDGEYNVCDTFVKGIKIEK